MPSTGLFSAAAAVLPQISNNASPQRQGLINELEQLLAKSPFLLESEKANMRKVIPIFNDTMIKDLKQTLIRQNLRYLQKKMAPANV